MNRHSIARIIISALITAVLVTIIVPVNSMLSFATTDHPIVVSLGDSYSSGEGVEPFYGQGDDHNESNYDWLAHRSEKSWPGKLKIYASDGNRVLLSDVKDGGKKADWFFLAASGAETRHLYEEQIGKMCYFTRDSLTVTTIPDEKIYTIQPQLKALKEKEIPKGAIDYVTITIGGNDAGFVDIIRTAAVENIIVLNPNALRDKLNYVWIKYYSEIEKNLIRSYEGIQKAVGNQANIIVAGYPALIDESGPLNDGITREEAQLINQNVRLFNEKIKDLITDLHDNAGMKIYFVSVEEVFEGHAAYSEDEYINPIMFGARSQDVDQLGPVSAYSLHPNDKGTSAYAQAVQQVIDQLEEPKAWKGGAVPDTSGAEDGKTRDISLVLDTSGSMDGKPLSEVKTAAERFGDAVIGSDARVGVVSFNDEANVIMSLTGASDDISKAANELRSGGGTDIGEGLKAAAGMLSNSTADKKIVVLMTDGEPTSGMTEEEIIEYADKLKSKGYYIYTLGFFSDMSPGTKSAPQQLLEKVASEGCHYEVRDASDLKFFFGDIADQINGVRFNYIRIACPVEVTVNYNGETLSSMDTDKRARTSFGTLTFEDAYDIDEDSGAEEVSDAIKILRLREGPEYDIEIKGTDYGYMNYTIGFVNDDGEYSDMRFFDDIEVCADTDISTVAKASDTTRLTVDYDGDGAIDSTYEAKASSHAVIVDNTWVVIITLLVMFAGFAFIMYKTIGSMRKNRKL